MTPLVEKISQHVYWMAPDGRTDRPSLAAVVGQRGTLMLDAANSPAHMELFLEGLAAHDVPPPKYMALTHWHWDHHFGAAALPDALLFAHRLTAAEMSLQVHYRWDKEALDARVASGVEIAFCRDMFLEEFTPAQRKRLQLRTPDVVFDHALTFDLGDVRVELEHVGGDHAADSVVMSIPQDRVLFLGDCLYPAIYAPERYYQPNRLFDLLSKVSAFDAEHYIEGHNDTVTAASDMQTIIDELHTVGLLVRRCGVDMVKLEHEFKVTIGRVPTEDDRALIGEMVRGLGMQRA